MRKYLLSLACCLLVPVGHFSANNLQQPNFCQLFGSVFIEENNPDRADFLIFEESSDAFCDVVVYAEMDNRLFANKEGLWHITTRRGFEDFSVYFVDKRNAADFSVYFTDVESFAGCNN